jgi:hypothetical protein
MKKIIVFPALALIAVLFTSSALIKPTVAYEVDTVAFENVLKKFPVGQFPFEVSEYSLKQEMNNVNTQSKNTNRILLGQDDVTDLPYVNNGTRFFSRVPEYVEAITRLNTQQFITLIYAKYVPYSQMEKTYYVAVFDKNYKFVSSEKIQPAYEEFKVFFLTNNLNLTVKTMKPIWSKEDKNYRRTLEDFDFLVEEKVDLKVAEAFPTPKKEFKANKKQADKKTEPSRAK